MAQEDFDHLFPGFRTEPLKLIVVGASPSNSANPLEADQVPGLTGQFELAGGDKGNVNVLSAGLGDKRDADQVIDALRRCPRHRACR